jgi:hypothetical protein
VDLPPDVDRLLTGLRDRLVARGGLVGLYLYGSLTTGDFSPARSDVDVLAMLAQDPDEAAVRELGRLHAALAAADDPAGRLHCLYVPADGAGDPEALRAYWYGGRMTQWQVKVLTRAELRDGLSLHGPWPPPGITAPSTGEVQAAVHAEITGYWRRMARRRRIWLSDSWVDFGLITLPRAEAVLTGGTLITKSQAISRLAGFGVPAGLAGQISGRRAGETIRVPALQRISRGFLARRIMQRGVRRLGSLRAGSMQAEGGTR